MLSPLPRRYSHFVFRLPCRPLLLSSAVHYCIIIAILADPLPIHVFMLQHTDLVCSPVSPRVSSLLPQGGNLLSAGMAVSITSARSLRRYRQHTRYGGTYPLMCDISGRLSVCLTLPSRCPFPLALPPLTPAPLPRLLPSPYSRTPEAAVVFCLVSRDLHLAGSHLISDRQPIVCSFFPSPFPSPNPIHMLNPLSCPPCFSIVCAPFSCTSSHMYTGCDADLHGDVVAFIYHSK